MFTKTLKLLVLVGALAFSYKSFAQPTFVVQNVKGSCEGFSNGSFDVLVTAGTGSVNLFYFSGPLFGGPFPATVGTPVTISGLAGAAFPGRVYQLVVQDAVDFSTTNVNIISYPTPLSITIDNVADNTDCITSNGSISVTPAGGSGSFTYSWVESSLGFTANTQDISNLLGGNYSLTITDNNTNCVETFPPIAVANPSPIDFNLLNVPSPTPVCSGSNLTLNLDGSEVGATYEVFRNLAATGITQIGTGSPLNFTVPSGTFNNGDNFRIKATNGICEGFMSNSVIVSILPLPTASISGTATICSAGSTNLTFTLPAGTYNVVYTDGTTNFNATGISNGATVSVSPTANTTYTIVSVTNTVTLCTSTAPSPNITGSAVISVNPLPTASIAGTATICTGGSAQLTFTLPSPGTFNVVYTDGTTNFNANGISNGATVNVNPTVNTTYTIVSVTDVATSCAVTAPSPNITGSAIVTVNPLPTASISGTVTICSGNNAVLTFTLSAGTYDVVYTDGTTNVTLNGISSGATVNVTPAANTTYTIVSITNTAIASCTVTAPSPNITGSAVVTVNPSPTASISGTTAICNGANAVLTFTLPATGTFDVVYTDGTTNYNANGISNGATVNVNPTTNTTYTIVSVTNTATSCSSIAPSPNITGSAVITVNPLPTASISGTTTICLGNSATLTFTLPAPGTFNVVYTDGTTNFSANGIGNGATVSVSPTANTTYTIVSVTDVATTCSVTAPNPNITGNAVVTVNPLPTGSISGTTTICSGSSVTLTFTLPAPGTFDVVYTDGTTNFNANGITNGATVNVTPASSATYTIVSVTNTVSLCTVTAPSPNITGSAVVTVNPLPTASIGGTATICSGGTTALTFTLPSPGTFDVVYTDGTTNFNANGISNGATVNVSPTATITYTIVSVTNTTTTCTVSAPSPNITGSAVITVSPLPVANISGTASICAGASTALTFTLSAGTYNVVYTDGTTNFNATGISNGATVNVSPSANTTYTIVSVTNTTSSCTVTAPNPNITGSAIITVNPAPVASITGTVTICGGATATLTFNLSAGTFNVVYTDGTTNFNANGIVNGATVNVTPAATTTYTIVSVTNTTSLCSVTAPNPNITGSAIITVNPPPTSAVLAVVGPGSICTGSGATLAVTITGGTSPYTITIDNGVGTINNYVSGTPIPVSPTATTTYAMVGDVTDAAGCAVAGSGTAQVTVSPIPTITINPIAPVCVGATTASLVYTATTGAPDQYIIDFNGAAQAQGFVDVVNAPLTASPVSITVSATAVAGTYNGNLFVRNSTSGCLSAPTPISITLSSGPTATITGTTSVCAGSTTNITVTLTGTAPWTFTYTDGTTNFPTVTSSSAISFPVTPTTTTTYTLVSVSDASVTACPGTVSGTAVVTVNQPPQTNLAVGVTIDPLCSGGTTDVTVDNSQVGVSYQLRNDAGDVPIGPAVIGTGGTINLPTGALTANTTFNVLATATGCTPVELTNTATVTVAGAINAGLSVTAAANPLCSGNSTDIQVANSENGVLYQLRNDANDSNIGSAVAGNGGTINLPTGVLAATTAFNVLASNGTCSIELTDIETVTVSPSPDPSLAVAVTLTPLCVGGSTTITVALSQTGISYQLRNDVGDVPVGSAVVGNGGTISLPTGVLNATTTFNILAAGTGCPPVELTAQATVTVSGSVDASLTLVAAASPICQGTGTDIQIAGSETGVTYQLRNDANDANVGAPVAGTGATILLPTGNLAATTTFNVLASNGSCSLELTDLETVNVDIAPNAGLAVGATLNPLCVGGVSAVTVASSQVGVTYQLRNDAGDINVGPAVVGTGGTLNLSTGVLNATTTFNVLATSGVCPPVELTALATVTVAGSLNSGLTVTSSAGTICGGTSTFIQVQASENGVSYQLRNDLNDSNIGSPVVGTGGTINIPTGNLAATTTFNIVASNGTCSIELTDTETVTVTPGPATNLTVTAASTLICSGASTNIVIAASENGVSYQLRNNVGNTPIGAPVVGTGGNILLPTGNLTANTTFNVLASVGSCSAQLTATPTVTIRPVGDPACGGGGTDCANFNAIIPTIVTQPSCNDRDAGEVSFTISRFDGTPTTFRVLWSINGTTQTKFTSNTVTFDDLSSGNYQYTVIDEGNGKACGPVDFFLDLKTQVEILDKQVTANVTCFGGTDGNAILTVDGTTTGEYWYKYVLDGVESSAQTFTPGAPLPGGLPADDTDFIIIKVDETFNFLCPDTVMVRIKHTFPKIDYTVASTEVSTCNGTDGSILVSSIAGGDSGSNPLQVRLKKAVPFTTDPSGYIVFIDYEDVVNGEKEYLDLAQGNYVVDVKDNLDCIQSKPIAVQAPGQVPLASVTITPGDATCVNEGVSGFITVAISDAGLYEVAVSQDQLNVPDDDQFVDYPSPGLPSITFNNLVRGAYYIYIKSATTTCPTRTDAIAVGGVQAIGSFDVLSNCENPNLTINNITGQIDAPFVIRVFDNDDKFFKVDSLTSSNIPLSKSVTFVYNPPLQHSFLVMPGSYRFVMVQTQTFGTSTCTLVSDTVVYDVRLGLNITLGEVKPSFPDPKRTGSIEVADIDGGTRFVSPSNELYYEIALYDADDDIVVEDWTQVKLDPQNKFKKLYEYLPPGVYRIKVRDESGCEKTIDTEITLDPSIYVPNVFTPNDDAVNDTFEVLNLPLTGQHKLIVSNRWGNEVFKSNDYRDGNFWNANETSDGIYFYRLQVDGGDTYTGWVEIIRGNKP